MPDTPVQHTAARATALPPAELLGVEEVATALRCSPRHVQRLASSRRLPESITVGSLRRWRRHDIDWWIYLGCPDQDAFVAERHRRQLAKEQR